MTPQIPQHINSAKLYGRTPYIPKQDSLKPAPTPETPKHSNHKHLNRLNPYSPEMLNNNFCSPLKVVVYRNPYRKT